MAGFELYEEIDDSDASFNARHTHIIASAPVDTTASADCTIRGWEYIPNGANSAGPDMMFGFVRLDQGSNSKYREGLLNGTSIHQRPINSLTCRSIACDRLFGDEQSEYCM